MKTVTQYKEDIRALMKKSADIDAKCIAENRDPNESELTLKNEILDTVKEYKHIVDTLDRQKRIAEELEGPSNTPVTIHKSNKIDIPKDSRNKDKFGSFGEQLAAVMNASRPGGRMDPRLLNAAATGMSETVSSDGGFLIQQDFSTDLLQDVIQTGILASRCRNFPISANANGIKIPGVDETSRASTRMGGVIGYWKDEAGTKTASKPKFRMIDLQLKKLIGLCYATDELLQDAAALESFIKQAFVSEFGFLLDDAIVNGTGAGMPLGVMNAGCLVSVAKETGQTAATILPQNIVNMYSRRLPGQLSNYAWFYNQTIEPQLFTMTLDAGTGGVPIFMPPGGLSDAPYARILGLPAIAIEQCQALGTQGDIILANFRDGYYLAEKGGIQSDMSIHVAFLADESVFRFVMRVDGQPQRAQALTPYKGGATATQSHFITLDTRS